MTMIGFSKRFFGSACRGGTGGILSSWRRIDAGNRSPPLKYLTVTVALPEGTIVSAGALFLFGKAMVRTGVPGSPAISRYHASG